MDISVSIFNPLTKEESHFELQFDNKISENYIKRYHSNLIELKPDCYVDFSWGNGKFLCGEPLNMKLDFESMSRDDYDNKWFNLNKNSSDELWPSDVEVPMIFDHEISQKPIQIKLDDIKEKLSNRVRGIFDDISNDYNAELKLYIPEMDPSNLISISNEKKALYDMMTENLNKINNISNTFELIQFMSKVDDSPFFVEAEEDLFKELFNIQISYK